MAHYKKFLSEHALRGRGGIVLALSVRKIAMRKRPFNLIIFDFLLMLKMMPALDPLSRFSRSATLRPGSHHLQVPGQSGQIAPG